MTTERYVPLDGGGSLYVRLDANPFRLSLRDRRLVFAVADALAAHRYPVVELLDPRDAAPLEIE